MNLSAIKAAIRARMAAWKAEGDNGPDLLRDAFLHLRWRLEEQSLDSALEDMLSSK